MKIVYEIEDVLQIIKREVAKKLGIPQNKIVVTHGTLSYDRSITAEVAKETEEKE